MIEAGVLAAVMLSLLRSMTDTVEDILVALLSCAQVFFIQDPGSCRPIFLSISGLYKTLLGHFASAFDCIACAVLGVNTANHPACRGHVYQLYALIPDIAFNFMAIIAVISIVVKAWDGLLCVAGMLDTLWQRRAAAAAPMAIRRAVPRQLREKRRAMAR